MSELLGAAVVLAAVVATLHIALRQPDQTATSPAPTAGGHSMRARFRHRARSGRRTKLRSGFALVVTVVFVGTALAVTVAGVVLVLMRLLDRAVS